MNDFSLVVFRGCTPYKPTCKNSNSMLDKVYRITDTRIAKQVTISNREEEKITRKRNRIRTRWMTSLEEFKTDFDS